MWPNVNIFVLYYLQVDAMKRTIVYDKISQRPVKKVATEIDIRNQMAALYIEADLHVRILDQEMVDVDSALDIPDKSAVPVTTDVKFMFPEMQKSEIPKFILDRFTFH